jgi:hypothetical protein
VVPLRRDEGEPDQPGDDRADADQRLCFEIFVELPHGDRDEDDQAERQRRLHDCERGERERDHLDAERCDVQHGAADPERLPDEFEQEPGAKRLGSRDLSCFERLHRRAAVGHHR